MESIESTLHKLPKICKVAKSINEVLVAVNAEGSSTDRKSSCAKLPAIVRHVHAPA